MQAKMQVRVMIFPRSLSLGFEVINFYLANRKMTFLLYTFAKTWRIPRETGNTGLELEIEKLTSQ